MLIHVTYFYFIDGHCNQLVKNQSHFLTLVFISMATEPVQNNSFTVFHLIQFNSVQNIIASKYPYSIISTK